MADSRIEDPDRLPSVYPAIRLSDFPPTGRLIGVDWGEKRIGLAVSDPSRTVATPLDTLLRRTGRRFPMQKFREHVDRYQPAGVVVGLPLESDGSEGPSATAAREIGDQITRVTGIPVAYFDERMTTSRVRKSIAEMGGRTRGREAQVDRLAATVLLQAFLDTHRS